MSVATIAAVATYAMAAYSTVVAIKAIADGDYTTALIAGVGAVAGFSAAGGMMANAAANSAQAAGSAVAANVATPMATGTTIANTAATNAANIGMTGQAGSLLSGVSNVSTALPGLAGQGALAPTAGALATSTATSAPSFSGTVGDLFKSAGKGIGNVVDNIQQIGADLFKDVKTGNLMNSAGKSLGNIGGGGTLGSLSQIASPLLKYQSQKNQQEASDKAREQEKEYIDRDWANRNYIPKVNALRPMEYS